MAMAFFIGWSASYSLSTSTSDAFFWQSISLALGAAALIASITMPFGSIIAFLAFLLLSAAPFFFWATAVLSVSRNESRSALFINAATVCGACLGVGLAPWFVAALDPIKTAVAALVVGGILTALARPRRPAIPISSIAVILALGIWVTGGNLSATPRWSDVPKVTEKALYANVGAGKLLDRATSWIDLARIDVALTPLFGENLLAVFRDGSFAGLSPDITSASAPESIRKNFPLFALSLSAAPVNSVLVINSPRGLANLATKFGVTHIRSLGGVSFAFKNAKIEDADLNFHSADPRSPRQGDTRYDLIFLSISSPPIFGLFEQNPSTDRLFTKEAFQEYWRLLKPHGKLAISGFEETFYTRAILTAWEVLSEDRTIENTYLVPKAWGFRRPLTAIPWVRGEYLFLLSKGNVDQNLVNEVSELGASLGLFPLFGPAMRPPTTFNIQENPYYVLYHPGGLEPAREALQGYFSWVVGYPLDMSAAGESGPSFFHIARDLHPYFKTLILLCSLALSAVFFLCCPEYRSLNNARSLPLPIFLSYFPCLGSAAAFATVAMIYQGVLLLNFSLDLSLAVVLIGLLLGVGASMIPLWSRFSTKSSYLIGMALLSLVLAAWALSQSIPSMPIQGLSVHIALLAALAAPIGLVSATLMQIGSSRLAQTVQGLLPWAWVTLGLSLLLGTVVAFWVIQTRGWPAAWAITLIGYVILGLTILTVSQYQKKFGTARPISGPSLGGKAKSVRSRAGKRRGRYSASRVR